ncbi:acid phosphatase [Striga asiatica]|uniref:Multiple inositol polyphosphate phosphatase 1 n=1 Tax=Striga asiatica TaxID=4170 RepID=A0A5A7REB4_STRAF|nr:acid phosphatase [Striga asiatica]
MEAATQIVLLMLLFIATVVPLSVSGENFDVCRHLSTVTRYQVAKDISENSYIPSTIPDQCRPVHLNLVEQSVSVVPAWLRGWKSPWTGKYKGGELISEGENELYELGIRTRERFPELFNENYHTDIYPIKATQISGASASAVAFGLCLFSGRGNLGPERNRAFVVTSESRASDIMLRFHDCCQNYKVKSLLKSLWECIIGVCLYYVPAYSTGTCMCMCN